MAMVPCVRKKTIMEKEVKSGYSKGMESYPLLVNVVDQLYYRHLSYMDILGRSKSARTYDVFFEEVLSVVFPSSVADKEWKGGAI